MQEIKLLNLDEQEYPIQTLIDPEVKEVVIVRMTALKITVFVVEGLHTRSPGGENQFAMWEKTFLGNYGGILPIEKELIHTMDAKINHV